MPMMNYEQKLFDSKWGACHDLMHPNYCQITIMYVCVGEREREERERECGRDHQQVG